MKISVGLLGFEPIPVTVYLQRVAEFVAVPITIKSDQKYHRDRLIEIEKTRRYFAQEVQKNSLLSIRSGAKQMTNIGKAGILSSGQTASTILLRIKLSGDTATLFIGAERLQNFLEALNPIGKTEFEIGDASLEVENPESYREHLLGLIREDMNKTLTVLGGNGTLSISGLETPVLLSQIDEQSVGLYIKYLLTLNTAAR